MVFNPIIDPLPEEWEGVKIKTDFKNVLRFFKLLDDDRFTEFEKNTMVQQLFFAEPVKDLNGFFSWYLSCGEDSSGGSGKRVIDFNIDAGKIYSAFRQVYGVDLRTEPMHWFTFKALFDGLPEGTFLAKVIEIRQKKIPQRDKHNADYVDSVVKAKEYFALDKSDVYGDPADAAKGWG